MKWQQIIYDESFADIPGMDLRAAWLLGPGLDDFLPEGEGQLVPFVIQLLDQQAVELALKLVQEPEAQIFVPWSDPEYQALRSQPPPPQAQITAFAPASFFGKIRSLQSELSPFREALKQIMLCLPLPRSALPPGELAGIAPKALFAPPDPVLDQRPVPGWPDDTVVMGIIDDGIAFAHERFRTADGKTRVHYFWRQDGPYDGTASTVDYGREISKAGQGGIDELLRLARVGGNVDEEEVYRRARLIDRAEPGHKAAGWRIAHGTHVLDLAAGADPNDDVTNRPIICVQLPVATTQDTAGADLADRVRDGIYYILSRAGALSASQQHPLPVVINISYGTLAGPHDGSSPIEMMFEKVLRENPQLRIALPAGNANLGRCHAEIAFDGSGTQTISVPWRVHPDDRTPSFVEIWLPPADDGASRVTLTVVTPDGAESPPVREGDTRTCAELLVEGDGRDMANWTHDERVLCIARYMRRPTLTKSGLFHIVLQPTARNLPTAKSSLDARVAPAGPWTIKLHSQSLRPTDVLQAWIQRDETIFGYPLRGRQSHFDDPSYVRFDQTGQVIEDDDHPLQAATPSVVKRDGSINAMAMGANTIVAGGFLRKERRLAAYSAGDSVLALPSQAGEESTPRKPDAVLVSDDSKVHAGVLAAGTRSGSVVALNGTSVAAPQLARMLASQLASAKRPPSDPPKSPAAPRKADRDSVKSEAVKAEAARNEAHKRGTHRPGQVPAVPRLRAGWGRIERPPVVRLPRYWD